MPLSTLQSLTFVGFRPIPVHIEVHLSSGLPSFAIVGLPDAEIRESRERVRSALLNSGFEFPSQRITVNLAPADLPKGTAGFDLAIALGIASASGQLGKANLRKWLFAAELSLSGELKAVRAPFAVAAAARRMGAAQPDGLSLMLPQSQAALAARVPGVDVYGASSLFEAAAHLVGHGDPIQAARPTSVNRVEAHQADMAEVVGHESVKHAILTSVAGFHHIRLVGSPGSGKSMLAQRMVGLLPELPLEEALEVSTLRSLKGEGDELSASRPFRSPHCSVSPAALIGGGNPPSPGEISLAHQGVLFTDELLEYDRRALEGLREPLETGRVNIARAGYQATFPAKFLWVSAHNPCPCGWYGHVARGCRCTPEQVRRYQFKLSGPLMDRIDISVDVQAIDHSQLLNDASSRLRSSDYATQVRTARSLQLNRQGCLNGELMPGQINLHCKPTVEGERLLLSYANKHHLSARSLHRICRVARTLADLEACTKIEKHHVATAIQYRKALNPAPPLATPMMATT